MSTHATLRSALPQADLRVISGTAAPAARAHGAGQVVLEHLGVRFGQGARAVDAVQDVSLHIAPGEFVSIVGPSGCGKSTLLNVDWNK